MSELPTSTAPLLIGAKKASSSSSKEPPPRLAPAATCQSLSAERPMNKATTSAVNLVASNPCNNQRRRNSYAASPTFNEYDVIREEMMTPTMTSSHAQFLDPASALRRYPSGGRRQLPPTPAGEQDPDSKSLSSMSDLSVPVRRRGSSPRVLPTPPPEQEQGSAAPVKLDKRTASSQALFDGIERRPSSGRKLPMPPPETILPPADSAIHTTHPPVSPIASRSVEYARRK